MPFASSWTEAELKRLKAMYARGDSVAVMARKLDRGESGLYDQIRRLVARGQLVKRAPRPKGRPAKPPKPFVPRKDHGWSEDEDETLRACWEPEGGPWCAVALGRSMKDVTLRARELGLPPEPDWTEKTHADIDPKRMYPDRDPADRWLGGSGGRF